MRNKTKRLTAFLLTAAVALGATGCGTVSGSSKGGASASIVNIGVQTLITPELVTRYEKLYEKYLGMKVNLVQFNSGADINKAFSSKSLDIASIGSSPVSIGLANNLGYEVIWYHDVIGSAESLVATKASGIHKIEDLKGKKVATPFASTAHYNLLNALKFAHMKTSDLQLLDMQPNDIYAAWQRGDIDAAYVWNPVLGEITKESGTVIMGSGDLVKKGVVTADLAVINKDFAAKHPAVATGYIKAQLYGLSQYQSNQSKAIKEIASAAGISETEAKNQAKGFTYPAGKEQLGAGYLGTAKEKGALAKTLKDTADFLVQQGSIDKSAPLSTFQNGITSEFIEKALREK
ncbi:MAG: ABC transporter substrate-binding protein [Oscillospiraceae bacterium]|jgi:taurine transport system substrate-binding protein|nr:ABC transporter substrate-binding protein [Oscillospiraceae bacterium]